ncbi:hypothetical protein ANCCAN_01319 [Ancylostoma caninum]|uniref:Uncharacterized protein n=1 Tax=Ancylostoma caninum TaxID=29170 RepID=A0A368HB79_ANCCA|nr:hypothetical protein ANCCAN_01319 [Ancylostoma caninum]
MQVERKEGDPFLNTQSFSAPNPIGIAKCDFVSTSDGGGPKTFCPISVESSTVSAPVQSADRKELDDKPALAPILMMTYLNNCMSNIKSTLNTNGLPVGLDANGRAVDYSSRPIDPIFQQARARMENAREFRELSPPSTLPAPTTLSVPTTHPASTTLPAPSTISAPTTLAAPTTLPQVSRSFEEGSGFSPIGVALPTVSSTAARPQVTTTVGVNRTVPDAVSPEKNEENDDSDPPEKRTKMMDGD